MDNTVFIPIGIGTVEEEQEKPSLTYRLDLAAGRIIGKVDGRAAVEQAILKAIITPRFHCLVYDNQYGSEVIEAIIADDAVIEDGAIVGAPPEDYPNRDDWGIAVVGQGAVVRSGEVILPKQMLAPGHGKES